MLESINIISYVFRVQLKKIHCVWWIKKLFQFSNSQKFFFLKNLVANQIFVLWATERLLWKIVKKNIKELYSPTIFMDFLELKNYIFIILADEAKKILSEILTYWSKEFAIYKNVTFEKQLLILMYFSFFRYCRLNQGLINSVYIFRNQ